MVFYNSGTERLTINMEGGKDGEWISPGQYTFIRDRDIKDTEVQAALKAFANSKKARADDLCVIFRPLEPGKMPLERAAIKTETGCVFRRNGDPNSSFLTAAPSGDGMLWVHNAGERSLRFQMPDGQIYRVFAGYTEALAPSDLRALAAPVQVLLDLGGNPLDLQSNAVHVRYGEFPWRRGGRPGGRKRLPSEGSG